ncbi:MAG: hypothetical protein FRX48_06902 [Lasallia pustulata]|uniref:Uncharacterized protein n=1 Tax=Lasallia pustulata TaxID=136370 RepID=A0A1W5D923_9LECA|nr:MAG: hypothetical protein FRX48_06902 [Lasallia pustulata]SLM39490.1 hypothetical protein LPUS_10039 [Lasallia pustulata]
MAATDAPSQEFTLTDPAEVGGVSGNNSDPFAAQRTTDNDPFATTEQTTREPLPDLLQPASADSSGMPRDRRMSKEWDASKVPPSRFQKREGSIYATPGSRDGHTGKGRDRDQSFHDKLKSKGWL